MADATDGDLARAVAAGTAGAAAAEAELCRRMVARVRLYGLRHLRDDQAALDLGQRVMVVMLEKLRAGEVRDLERIGAFVFGVARTLVLEGRRRERATVPLSDEATEAGRIEATDVDPMAAGRLERCLQALAERARSVVALTYFGEQATAQVAASLGMTEGNVRVARHRAIAQLRECMGLGDL